MSVETGTPETPTTEAPVSLDVITEVSTYVVTKRVAKEGEDASKIPLSFSVLKPKSTLQESIDKSEVEVLRRIEVSAPSAQTIAGMSQITPDVEEVTGLYNRGLSQKLTNKLRAIFTELSDDGTTFANNDETYDATELAATPTQSRSLTETQKALKAIKGLDDEKMAELLKIVMAERGLSL